jgi:hypothetical protein
MPFRKGHSGNASGRPKGASNKTTKELRDVLHKIIEKNINTLAKDFRTLTPESRIRLLLQMTEFVLPKLQRTELNTGAENENGYEENFVILSNGERIPY